LLTLLTVQTNFQQLKARLLLVSPLFSIYEANNESADTGLYEVLLVRYCVTVSTIVSTEHADIPQHRRRMANAIEAAGPTGKAQYGS